MGSSRGRASRRESKQPRREGRSNTNVEFYDPQVRKEPKPLRALTESQFNYIESIKNNIITFSTGPAGTGKSFCAVAIACDMLKNGEIDRIIITRPGVEAGESFGFLPGEIEEKYAVYLDPILSIFHERLGRSFTDYCIKSKKIDPRPLAFMRGSTFSDAFIILDEAQDTTINQLKMFLTRLGENVTCVVNGDCDQTDIHGVSGLKDAIHRFKNAEQIGIVDFDIADIVRSGICRVILERYAKWNFTYPLLSGSYLSH